VRVFKITAAPLFTVLSCAHSLALAIPSPPRTHVEYIIILSLANIYNIIIYILRLYRCIASAFTYTQSIHIHVRIIFKSTIYVYAHKIRLDLWAVPRGISTPVTSFPPQAFMRIYTVIYIYIYIYMYTHTCAHNTLISFSEKLQSRSPVNRFSSALLPLFFIFIIHLLSSAVKSISCTAAIP
jgi:hypothetical protein